MSEEAAKPALHVVVIDDDEIDRISVRRSLRSGDGNTQIVIAEAEDCTSGLALLESRPFDCALVDMRLPDGDAFTIVNALRAGGRLRGPIIILTGIDDEQVAMGALKEGVQDYLVKGRLAGPILLRAIRYAMERFRIQEELAAATRQLERVAFLDPLTGVLNRRGLEHILKSELARADRQATPIFGVLIDCDDFKSINERFGHAGGDRVLVDIAKRIEAGIRREDHCARIGGDEFLVVLPNTGVADATRLADRIRHGIASTSFGAVSATVSMGVFPIPRDACGISDILSHAQTVLAYSKRSGKNAVSVQSQEDGARLIGALTGAQGERLRVVTQPIYRLSQLTTVAHELFIRGPSGPFELPDDLFAEARARRDVVELDLCCLRRCLEATSWLSGASFHLNLDAPTLLDRSDDVLAACVRERQTGLCIELSVKRLGDPHRFTPAVERLREAGVRIALEHCDFGPRSLEALVVLRPNLVKLAPKLALTALVDAKEATNLERIIRLSNSLSADVVACGIESAEALELVVRAGAQFGQGFFWGAVVEPGNSSNKR
ncbi:MAG: response regulator receiver modulated diguanylate cyclase/phosphodiesterase [Myxococcaceae bacterium]|nr:response regulator receiver modulated diguanylate cyclase/phosphodiesterase [Myxococcaceae bacterium]